MEYIAQDKTSTDADYLEDLVKDKLISESALKKVWMEHIRVRLGFGVPHMRLLTKKQPLKVHVEVIEKAPLADTLTSLLFSMMDAGMKDKGKG